MTRKTFTHLNGPRQDGYVRWIAITGLEPSVVVRLANRYRLHPLQVRLGTDRCTGLGWAGHNARFFHCH
jgi:hypothetical protein